MNKEVKDMFIGMKIRELRMVFNLSQPELAYRLKISQTAVCNIESGETKKIDFLLIEKICKEFEVDFDFFVKDKKLKNIPILDNQKLSHSDSIKNNCPESISGQIKILIDDNKTKEERIKELENKLKDYNIL